MKSYGKGELYRAKLQYFVRYTHCEACSRRPLAIGLTLTASLIFNFTRQLNIVRKLHTFVKLPARHKFLVLRLCYLLPKSRMAVKKVPFKVLAAKMGELSDPKELGATNEETEEALCIGRLTRGLGKLMPFRTMCFEQALSCAEVLRSKGISHCIHFGVKKDQSQPDSLQAHAWLQCGDEIVTGKRGYSQYQRLSSFYYEPI